jgi:Ran GTPase-activating protein (RanGAP) involved in mRNA processing and transport
MYSSFPLRIHHYISIQALTTLDLENNNIGAEGARRLAQALQNNTVIDVFFFSTKYSPLSFNTDTHHAQSWMQLHR